MELANSFEQTAQAMLLTRGDLIKVSRKTGQNIMVLRTLVQQNPEIRARYQELLAAEMQEKGLHIAERIIKMAELQEQAFGGMIEDPTPGDMVEHLQDPKMVIELSKEISRLISEGKGTNISTKAAVLLASKEDAKEILAGFLDS
jgi:predicted regulator of amino acid metabolism with ACT domain